ncbi:1-deoxy-D-xylulose-5-phosphate synthase [Bacteroidales bacterium OttesenSCG-928-B11]|nr:1-deoxy-D-xylulose-5-phosphate synthase [Bacteroidales bacterium OttesenSCG-928-E04]MDL2307959.1 1-deoxy-D-xylulose-5-phosphate synthase [Bacteroidales bacterium OttesenSCG-928-C03]MDL2311680.1 1-deoxy-D-xylulose-5-phosphate synthase [Bacteroidales bacterium OttesenSCG-928-B11]MDL2325749.1 1-deoxy-D-xylulose-5-phosphate synthase [Bacteroidales bacterium OttesenSCG-928-A14]
MSILDNINYPSDLKKLELDQLPVVCEELRNFIITNTAENPGHLGASLGTVELTVALHYVFDMPDDKIVWDVGHQAYGHKILTGRKGQFHTNRKYKGISGFPKTSESEYDVFGAGHSSTSISAVLGMATASELKGEPQRNHIAVIGDGAMGGGMAFEAMNQAGTSNANLLIVLNDNHISIDDSVGGVSQHLLNITSSPTYNRFKNKLWDFFTLKTDRANWLTRFLSSLGNVVKGYLLSGSNMFQSMGFRYFGPANGHDVIQLVEVFRSLKTIPGPKLFHVVTVKGKGLLMAEQDQTTYHAPGRFNPDTGEIIECSKPNEPPKYQTVFGETIVELAKNDPKVVGITPAMATGCSLTIMRNVFPERVFDVGIAEQHAVTFSAGLAQSGAIPFCNIYSSFMQRGYDQVIHDVALQNLPVIFCLDRAGLVGEDGATHHGAYDLSFMRGIPNMTIASPINEKNLRNLMYTAYLNRENPFTIRYPRGKGVTTEWRTPLEKMEIGKANQLRKGEKMAVLSLGPLGNTVSKALDLLETENINPAHIDMIFLKPLDEKMLHQVAKDYPIIVTVEDGSVVGGLFSAMSEFLQKNNYKNRLHAIALPDRFVEHGDMESLYKEVGFDADSMVNNLKIWFKE